MFFKGEHFRWVENDAHIVIASEKQDHAEIALNVEAGPGVGRNCLLKLLDASGRQVASALVRGKQAIKLYAAVAAGATEFTLHVDGGGKHIPSDPRILNFRVFQISAARPKSPLTINGSLRQKYSGSLIVLQNVH